MKAPSLRIVFVPTETRVCAGPGGHDHIPEIAAIMGAQLIGEGIGGDLARPLFAVDDAGHIDLCDPPVTGDTGIVTELARQPSRCR